MTDKNGFLYKSRIFSTDIYDGEHRKHAAFRPGFKLLQLAGGDLLVIGILNKVGRLNDMDDIRKKPATVATTFFNEVFNPSVRQLSYSTRTRQRNAAESGTMYLPKCYRLYPEDIQSLSDNVKAAFRARPSDSTFHFFFVFFKYGQQQKISVPPSLQSLSLDTLVANPGQLEYASCHFAATMGHTDRSMSVFWDTDRTARFLRSRKKVAKYPLMGLAEIGNVTSNCPEVCSAW